MIETVARTCYRRRRRIVLAWVSLLAAAIVVSSSLGGELRNDFTLPGSESHAAAEMLERAGFIGEAGWRGQLVVAADGGVDTPEVRAWFEEFVGTVETTVDDVSIRDPFEPGGLISDDGTVAVADVEFGDIELDVAVARAAEIAELRQASMDRDEIGAEIRLELGGEVFYEESEFSSEGFGLLAAVVILIIAFGSVLAMGLPIITALFGIGSGMAIVFLAAHLIDIPDFAPAATAMVTIGVGIDYSLFIVTRYREELAAGREPEDAVVTAMATAGRSVLFAGTTVVIALLGLLLVGVASTQSLAIAISSGVLMVMLAALTLLPAILGFVGHNIDRLTIGRRRAPVAGPTSVWYRWSRLVQRRPARVAVFGFAIVLLLSAPLFSMRLGFGDASNRPDTDTARRAYDLVADGFGPGFNGPLFVAVDLSGDTFGDRASLNRIGVALDDDPGIDVVTAPLVNDVGDVAVIQAFPTTSPQEAATAELVERLRDHVLPAAGNGADVLVGGAVAGVVDFADVQSSRMPLFIGAVLLVSFLVLTAVFRSIPVAFKAVVLNLLSISAAYGILVAVFQWGWGADLLGLGQPGPIEAWAPMMLFAILFGLSMDYEVFLLSRIKEEYDRTGDNATAVADGLARTARLITAAAGIMIFVFGGFVLSDERALQLFGFGLAAAILVDVTVVRLLLVPATMELLGNRNWWLPRWLDRRLPHLAVEPPAIAAAPARASRLERTPTLTSATTRPDRE